MQNRFLTKTRILITCPKRMTTYLRMEAEALGYAVLQEAPAGILTEGTFTDAMRLNLHIRTGHRVLFQLGRFFLRSPDDLFKSVSTIDWENIIPADGYLSVISSVETESITNTQFANVKCKDAIVDRIRKKRGTRPDSGPDTSRAVVFLYWKDSECFIYLDTSGESLSQRGYRTMPWKAPMRESLASAVIMATKWDKISPFVNPMCGSGTLAIEAAQIALNQAPGLTRENFGFMHVLGYNHDARKVWKVLQNKAREAMLTELPFAIIASDMSEEAVTAARHNAEKAGVERFLRFEVCDFAQTTVPEALANTQPAVMLNPEYGLRLGDETALEATYKAIGDFFKQCCAGYMGYVFTGNLDLAKKIGLKAKRRVEFYNADVECRLLEYELYAGTRRTDV
ncbi:MAG: class I SAM-dependent RNA methyltransferase [Candidatus Kapabacteria bacterium]|jgi:putative N6-adenine-specific DNA methylase|nr:class I SAM-dependent RNA methyltransferase [Candidatus Kapabacteria bacterium]